MNRSGGAAGGPRRGRWTTLLVLPVPLAAMGLAGTAAMAGSAHADSWDTYTFVVNQAGNSITGYAPGANGDAAPAVTISGSNTGLDEDNFIARDPDGNVWVTNFGNDSVTEYAPDASGNAAPIETIKGAATGVDEPNGIAFDQKGDLWIADLGDNSVTEYAPGANGNQAPIATISGAATGLDYPDGLTFDSAGDLWVGNSDLTGPSDYPGTVTEYAPGANGDATPITTITGTGTDLAWIGGLAFDSAGDLWVANQKSVSSAGCGAAACDGSITEYAPGANGDATPITTITGSGVAEPDGLAFDSAGDLWVANWDNSTVTEYGPDAGDGATPIVTLSGADTGLTENAPHAVLPALARPGAPTIGTATGGDGQASVSFTPPANDGGSRVTGYTVTATDTANPANGGQTATGAGSPVTVTGLTNGDTYSFTVTAANAVGTGPASASASVTLASAATAPKVTTVSAPGTAAAGTQYSAQFAISGTPAPTVTLGDGAPGWLSVSGGGHVTGTPPAGTRSFSYDVIAANTAGSATSKKVTVAVSDQADVRAKLACPSGLTAGKAATCTLTVTNAGPALAAGAVAGAAVTGPLTVTGCTDGCSRVHGLLGWKLGSLADGQSVTLTIDVTGTKAGIGWVTAAAGSASPDPDPFNNLAAAAVRVARS